MSSHSLVLLERLPHGVAKLVLNNPPLNLVTLDMTHQLDELLVKIREDENIRVVVVSSSTERAFCAGSDIKEFPHVRDNVIEKKLKRENEVFSAIEFLNKPTIAAIEGVACGGGLEIALACDLRIIAENGKVGLPEVKLGVFPGSGGVFRLPRLVGPSIAMELMYLGDFIDAHEAKRIGLVNRVVPQGEALKAAIELAERIAKQPVESIKAIKRGVRESFYRNHEENVQLTLEMSDIVFKTEDCQEGVRAFFEKREPKFKGVE